MKIDTLLVNVNKFKEKNPLYLCHYANGTTKAKTGHDALVAAIKGTEDGVELLCVESEDHNQTGVCGLANAILRASGGKV